MPEHSTNAFLDEMLEPDPAAKWLKVTVPKLLASSRGKRPKIPAARFGKKTVRFNPRTIIAKLANDAGVPPEVIAASMMLRTV